jgi:hypothetical protein
MLKSNVDGSFIGKPELVDIKGVLRNHKGFFLLSISFILFRVKYYVFLSEKKKVNKP